MIGIVITRDIIKVNERRVYRAAESGSNHFLLEAKVSFPFSKLVNSYQKSTNKNKTELVS